MTRAITVPQPRAWAVAHGGCNVLTGARWEPGLRGQVLIHAGAAWSEEAAADGRVHAAVDRVAGKFIGWHAYELAQLAGHVIAVADVVDVHLVFPAHRCCPPWGDPCPLGQRYSHVVLDNVQALDKPVRVDDVDHGRLWTPEPELLLEVASALGAAA